MSISTFQVINSIEPWLNRVTEQLKPETKKEEISYQIKPEAKKEEISYQEKSFRDDIRSSDFTNKYKIINNPAPVIINNPAPVVVNNPAPVIMNLSTSASVEKKKEEKKEEKKEKLSWQEIAFITSIAVPILSGSVFTHTRLAKTEQEAKNCLDKTLWIKQLANTFDASTVQKNPAAMSLKTVAAVQEKIDQNRIDKIKGYKHASLASLAGVLITTTGAVAMPWSRVAGTTAVIAGIVLGSGSIVYATYNLANHWSDQQEAQEQLTGVKSDLNQLEQFIRASKEHSDAPCASENSSTHLA